MGIAIQMKCSKDLITRLILAGHDVNTIVTTMPPQNVSSMLEYAAHCCNEHAFQAILPHVTCPKILTSAGNMAIYNRSLTMIESLIKAGASVGIMGAIRTETPHILEYLLEAGSEVRGQSLLYRCVHYCSLLMERFGSSVCGAYGYCRQKKKLYDAHAASGRLLQILMKHGAGLDEVYLPTGVSALRCSAASGLVCMTLDLLRAGCNPSIPDNNGCTALQYALDDCANRFLSANKRLRLTAIAAVLTEFIPYFSQEPAVLRLLRESHGTAVTLPPPLLALLRHNSSSPRPLQHLCRWAIIGSVKPQAHHKVARLGLPSRLVEYLLLADLSELNRDYADRMKPLHMDYCQYHRHLEPPLEEDPSPTPCACHPPALRH